MLKKLDLLIIRSFIGPFVVTFFITLFVLVMQFFWLYMDDLIGKGLGTWMILQLLLYMSTTLVPLALPLAVLLASIMTFGNLGESFELVAIKSAGISLNRFLRPLLVVVIVLSGAAFLFNNFVIPVANLKALSLLYDLRNSKPTLNIRPGTFNNDIDDYSIRVGWKGKDGKTIGDIHIYDHTSGIGNDKLVVAQKGEMVPSADKKALIFRLNDGWRYEEMHDRTTNGKNEQVRMHFRRWDKVFDLSGFTVKQTDQNLFAGDKKMMSVDQLEERMDSMDRDEVRSLKNVSDYMNPYISFINDNDESKRIVKKFEADKRPAKAYQTSFMDLIPDSMKNRTIQYATGNVRNLQQLMDITSTNISTANENSRGFHIEFHRKFSLSFACILLFLIGAPLGAIIRKGGLGLPMLFAIAFFLVWYIISFTGEEMSKSGAIQAWLGMWMSSLALLPLGLFLIRQARNDSQILSKEWYGRIFAAAKRYLTSRRKTTPIGQ